MQRTDRDDDESTEMTDRTFIDVADPTSETIEITRQADAYGLSYSDALGFEVMPYDRWGKPIHHHPLNQRAYPTPSDAYAAIREFERQRAA